MSACPSRGHALSSAGEARTDVPPDDTAVQRHALPYVFQKYDLYEETIVQEDAQLFFCHKIICSEAMTTCSVSAAGK